MEQVGRVLGEVESQPPGHVQGVELRPGGLERPRIVMDLTPPDAAVWVSGKESIPLGQPRLE